MADLIYIVEISKNEYLHISIIDKNEDYYNLSFSNSSTSVDIQLYISFPINVQGTIQVIWALIANAKIIALNGYLKIQRENKKSYKFTFEQFNSEKENIFIQYLSPSKLSEILISLFELVLYNTTMSSIDRQASEKYIIEFSKKFEDIGIPILGYNNIVSINIPQKNTPIELTEKITNACGDFMEALGYVYTTEDEPVYGSFFKKLKFLLKKKISDGELEELFDKGKLALELKHVALPSAEATEKLASAAEKLHNSLQHVDSGVIQLGILLIVKVTIKGKPTIITRTITRKTIKLLEDKPFLMKMPLKIFDHLTNDESDSNTHIENEKPKEIPPLLN